MPLSSFRRSAGLLALAFAFHPGPGIAAAQERVLIVVSGEGRDQGKTRPGFEMDEFSQAWLIFRANGLAVDVASPSGGKVEADKYNPEEAFNKTLLADGDAMRKLSDTHATRDVRAHDYSAVYVVGGKGAMFDLPFDPSLKKLLSALYGRGGVIAAVCHGPAALVDVRLADGSLLVAGRALTGFSNEEEAVFGKRWAKEFRFQLEDAMRERGARWHEAPLMMPKLVVDGRLITGQNPYSTPAVAEAIVKALGREPVARQAWRDEATMALVQRLLAGERDRVRVELATRLDRYHVELIGLLGYYQLQAANDDASVRDALSIMELARPHMPEPRLDAGIADAYWRLGDRVRARSLVAQLLASHPELEEARQLQARMYD